MLFKKNKKKNKEASLSIKGGNDYLSFALIIIHSANSDIFDLHMMRRFSCVGQRQFLRMAGTTAFEQMEKEQEAREKALNARKVVFASATSADNRPRQAAQEAFEVAASALPREPNFCLMNVSLDLETMIDAPEMVWGLLQSASANKGRMLGTAVNRQRFGGGFIQVMLGCIPDLECDVFTMDSVPTKEYLSREGVPPAFACVATVDASLARYHEGAIHHHMKSLKQRLGKVPFAGGVLQPVGRKGESSSDSIAFVDDRVFKGSAVACVLRSKFVTASSTAVVPSIELAKGSVTLSTEENEVIRILKIDGKNATDVIREVYETHIPDPNPSKIFIGIEHKGTLIPLSFTGNPEDSSLTLFLPEGVSLKDGDTIHLVCDEPLLDTELAAGTVMKDIERFSPVFAEKPVMVERESRKFITASSCAGVHFSNSLLNIPVRRDDVLAVGAGTQLFVPPVINRAVGRQAATAGIYCPAQLVDIAEEPYIIPRSANNMLWAGKE